MDGLQVSSTPSTSIGQEKCSAPTLTAPQSVSEDLSYYVRPYFYENGFLKKRAIIDKAGRYLHSSTGPALVWYYPNGRVQKHKYYTNGKLHRQGNLPAVEDFDIDGTVTYRAVYEHGKLKSQEWPTAQTPTEPTEHSFEVNEQGRKCWYKKWRNEAGELHCTFGPAVIKYHANRRPHIKEYYVDGKRHRTNGPAVETRDAQGRLTSELFYHNGLQVIQAPSVIHDTGNGRILRIWLDKHDNYHNASNRPAVELVRKTKKGVCVLERKYYLHGQLHGAEGRPAVIVYNNKGHLVYKSWYEFGVHSRTEYYNKKREVIPAGGVPRQCPDCVVEDKNSHEKWLCHKCKYNNVVNCQETVMNGYLTFMTLTTLKRHLMLN